MTSNFDVGRQILTWDVKMTLVVISRYLYREIEQYRATCYFTRHQPSVRYQVKACKVVYVTYFPRFLLQDCNHIHGLSYSVLEEKMCTVEESGLRIAIRPYWIIFDLGTIFVRIETK